MSVETKNERGALSSVSHKLDMSSEDYLPHNSLKQTEMQVTGGFGDDHDEHPPNVNPNCHQSSNGESSVDSKVKASVGIAFFVGRCPVLQPNLCVARSAKDEKRMSELILRGKTRNETSVHPRRNPMNVNQKPTDWK